MKHILMAMALFMGLAIECRAADIIVSQAVLSDCVNKSGSHGGVPVGQTMIGIESDGWYASVWNNVDLEKRVVSEIDYVIGKRVTVDHSYGRFSADLSIQRWCVAGSSENMLELVLKQNGPVCGSVIWTKQVTTGIASEKNRLYVELGKQAVFEGLTVTPSIAIAYLDGFYATNGWAHVTGRVRAEYPVRKNISLSVQGNVQHGLIQKKDDVVYGSVGFKLML
ncbi:MAG: hypothetical protein HGA31_00730 [Candidatus Moranbacteria bacterium]|nr:hypothetical protein [Candidatus Moranbacteria bacterium]